MRNLRPLLALVFLTFAGCDTFYGVRREAKLAELPDLAAVRARIESYPEMLEVKSSERTGGRPVTLTGLKPANRVFTFSYTDHANVHGTLVFDRNSKGEVAYSQH